MIFLHVRYCPNMSRLLNVISIRLFWLLQVLNLGILGLFYLFFFIWADGDMLIVNHHLFHRWVMTQLLNGTNTFNRTCLLDFGVCSSVWCFIYINWIVRFVLEVVEDMLYLLVSLPVNVWALIWFLPDISYFTSFLQNWNLGLLWSRANRLLGIFLWIRH